MVLPCLFVSFVNHQLSGYFPIVELVKSATEREMLSCLFREVSIAAMNVCVSKPSKSYHLKIIPSAFSTR